MCQVRFSLVDVANKGEESGNRYTRVLPDNVCM